MPKIKIICLGCDTDMYYLSSIGSSDNMIQKETWRCPACETEIMVVSRIEKNVKERDI
jgi:DNA-directed RNA polymerase subunit RPC12/RpoP